MVVKGTDTVADLSTWGLVLTSIAALLALTFLLIGSWSAMRAAFGVPGESILLSGGELKRWSDGQVRAGVADLALARRSFIAGVVLLAAAVAVTWVDAASSPDTLLKLEVGEHTYCGAQVDSPSGEIILDAGDPGGEQTVVRISDVTPVEIVDTFD